MRNQDDFRPLERIVNSVWTAATEQERKRYLVAAIAGHCFPSGVRYEVLAKSSGTEGWDEQFSDMHPLPLRYSGGTDHSFAIPMNATVSERILDRAARQNGAFLLKIFVELANAIGPHVNRQAIMRRSPEARLAGRLFDYDQVVSRFLKARAPIFYDETQEMWQWNSRYWEQVAHLNLARFYAMPDKEEGRQALAQAVQHARHAVFIETHPFSLTTLGRVLLAQLGIHGTPLQSTYEEAFARLTEAIEIERSEWDYMTVHAFVILFRGTHQFLKMGGRLSERQTLELRNILRLAERFFPRDQEMKNAAGELGAFL